MAEIVAVLRALNAEQRAAAVGAALLAISTFGPFSFVELAEIAVALGILALLWARGVGKRFHLPFGDGTVIAVGGIWAAALIVVRLFDRPLGQNLLALGCAAILIAVGARERAKHPPDDIPPERRRPPPSPRPDAPTAPTRVRTPARPVARPAAGEPAAAEPPTEPLAPPEFEPYRPQPNEQLRLGGEGAAPDEVRRPADDET
jgi:hypothetical protein